VSRIASYLEQQKREKRKVLVPYIVGGDPFRDVTVPTMHALVEAGADIIELGVPFSDPMAEGPVIQLAHERALKHNVSLRDVIGMVAEFRRSNKTTPVVLMGYANPIEVMGYEVFAQAAQAAGVDGVLIVDLPPEEAGDLTQALRRASLDMIYLIAPTTTTERARAIAQSASGYLYYVSLKGVTGAGHLDVESVAAKLAELRSITTLPVCVGFGIKDAASAAQIASLADGAVVGSALVQKMADLETQSQRDPASCAQVTASLIREMRRAIDR
jgi:tryptophan synthase alpha chain